MALTQFTKDMNIIAALSDDPNVTDGLTAAQLKAKFDEGGLAVKTYLNGTLKAFVDDLQSGSGLSSGAVSYSQTTGVQAKVRHIKVTVENTDWIKKTAALNGVIHYYHYTKLKLPALSYSLGDILSSADAVIIQPRQRATNYTAGGFVSEEELVGRFYNCDGVQFGISSYTPGGSLPNPYLNFYLVAFGWGNASGRSVELDIFIFHDADSTAKNAEIPMTPVPN